MAKLCSSARLGMSAWGTKYLHLFDTVMTTKLFTLLHLGAFVHYVPSVITLPFKATWTNRAALIVFIKEDSTNTLAAAETLQHEQGQLAKQKMLWIAVASKHNSWMWTIIEYFATVRMEPVNNRKGQKPDCWGFLRSMVTPKKTDTVLLGICDFWYNHWLPLAQHAPVQVLHSHKAQAAVLQKPRCEVILKQ